MEEKILLVDDEASIRRVMGASLSDKGYKVFTAKEGKEALDILRKEKPSIVLTDIKMPGMDGVALLSQIKAESPDTEVVMITGHGDMELAIESLKCQAADFITKPIDDRLLELSLNRVKDKIQMRETLRNYTRNLENLVARTRMRYRLLFDESPCYISVQDRGLCVVDANRRFKEDFQWEKDVFCYQAYKQQECPCEDCPVLKTFEDGQSHTSEMVVSLKNGITNHLLITTAPIRDANGELSQVIEMSTNITRIRELQDRLSSLGLLIGSVSHGIKGLITGLEGGVYLLKSGIDQSKRNDVDEGMEIVTMMAGRIRKLAMDILFYAKERKLNLEKVDMGVFAEDLAEMIRQKIQKDAGIAFITRFDPAIGIGEIDAGIVYSALINILENALDAVRKDRSKTSHEIQFLMRMEDEAWVFEITDDGVGMEEEILERLFTLSLLPEETTGAGLGLFVANKIIRQHGGRIEVDSQASQGSRFTIYLPQKGLLR